MKKNPAQKNPKKAFSLLELSIVILIISILIIGSMSASITAINNAKYKVTRERMAEIYKAMGVYLLTNKSLPCPASIKDLKSSASTYGIKGSTDGDCNDGDGVYAGATATSLVYGMIPVQTLGLNADMAEDGFGNKFTYIVAKEFTNPSVTTSDSTGFGRAPDTSATAPANAVITIKESLGGSFQTNTTDAIFVIISHGANKFGAFNNNAATQNTASTDADEQKNYGSTFTGTSNGTASFYSSYFVGSAVNSDVFDDVLLYKTRNVMLIDFNAFSLIVCKAIAAGATSSSVSTYYTATGSGTSVFAWPQAYYGQIVASSILCSADTSTYTTTVSYPTKRCGAYGVWQTGAINPCTN